MILNRICRRCDFSRFNQSGHHQTASATTSATTSAMHDKELIRIERMPYNTYHLPCRRSYL